MIHLFALVLFYFKRVKTVKTLKDKNLFFDVLITHTGKGYNHHHHLLATKEAQ